MLRYARQTAAQSVPASSSSTSTRQISATSPLSIYTNHQQAVGPEAKGRCGRWQPAPKNDHQSGDAAGLLQAALSCSLQLQQMGVISNAMGVMLDLLKSDGSWHTSLSLLTPAQIRDQSWPVVAT